MVDIRHTEDVIKELHLVCSNIEKGMKDEGESQRYSISSADAKRLVGTLTTTILILQQG